MKLYMYDDIRKLNQALGSFNRNKIPVSNINLVAVENKVQYFVFTDAAEDYETKPKVESKTEEIAKKEIKEKKEEKKEVKSSGHVVKPEDQVLNMKEEKKETPAKV